MWNLFGGRDLLLDEISIFASTVRVSIGLTVSRRTYVQAIFAP